MKPDLLDFIVVLGFAMLFAGLYLSIGLGWALAVGGAIVLALGILAIWGRRNG